MNRGGVEARLGQRGGLPAVFELLRDRIAIGSGRLVIRRCCATEQAKDQDREVRNHGGDSSWRIQFVSPELSPSADLHAMARWRKGGGYGSRFSTPDEGYRNG